MGTTEEIAVRNLGKGDERFNQYPDNISSNISTPIADLQALGKTVHESDSRKSPDPT